MSNTTTSTVYLCTVLLLLATCAVDCRTDVSKMGAPCTAEADCSLPYIVCRKGKCERKDLFPLTGAEIGAIFVLLLLVMLAIIFSLSGGLIIVPILLLMIGFSAKQAVVLSNAIVLLTSATKYVMGLFKSNPDAKFKTIVDYNAAIAMIPGITLFSTIGGMVSALLPDVLILFLMVAMLIMSMVSAVFQTKKQLALRRKRMEVAASTQRTNTEIEKLPPSSTERHLDKNANDVDKIANQTETANVEMDRLNELRAVEKVPENHPPDNGHAHAHSSADKENTVVPEENLKKLKNEIENQKKIEGNDFYWKKYLLIMTVLVVSILAGLFRGGKGLDSIVGISRCDPGDWIILAFYILILGCLPLYSYYVIMKEQSHKAAIGWNENPTEVFLTKKTFAMTVVWSMFTGIMSTITGLGGGVILTPFFAHLNYSPVTISWTINIMVLLSKIAAVLQGILSGQLLYYYVLFYGGMIAVMITIAEHTLLKIIKKTKSQVAIPVGIMIILAVSLTMNIYLGISEWIEKEQAGKNAWKFGKYC